MTPPSTHAADDTIRVQGVDACAFLNAQLTRRVDNLASGQTTLAAWCSAKGRVLALFHILRTDDAYLLRMPASLLPLTLARLRMFVLRSKVVIDPVAGAPAGVTTTALQNILAGIPQVYPETRDQFLPQMLNLDWLDAIDFKKGCYPGQEIVARTQYLGKLKRRMYRFSVDGITPPPPGSQLLHTENASGIVVDATQDDAGRCQLLAVVPIDVARAGWHLDTDDRPLLNPQPLPYPAT